MNIMRSILTTLVLLLVLPWKLNGGVTLSPNISSHHEDISEDHKPSTRVEKVTIHAEKKSGNSTTKSKPVVGLTSSESVPKESKEYHVTSVRNTETKNLLEISTGEIILSRLSSLEATKERLRRTTYNFQKNQTTTEAVTQKMMEVEGNSFTDGHQKLPNLTSVYNKDQKDDPPSTENWLVSNTSNTFKTTPEVFTEGQTRGQTRKSSQEQEKTDTNATTITPDVPNLLTSHSNGTLVNVNNAQTNGNIAALSSSSVVATNPLTSSKTSPDSSTELNVTVSIYTVSTTTRATIVKETDKTTVTATEKKTPTTVYVTNRTTQTKYKTHHLAPVGPKDPSTQNEKDKGHPGPIVASLIGLALVLMFVAIVVILVKNRQVKKKLMENPDWAGPSPFLEGGDQPNLPSVSEEGAFQRRESKRISLHSFLPQRFSKRLSLLREAEEEVQMGDMPASSSFGGSKQAEAQMQNGKPSVENDQAHPQKTEDPSPDFKDSSNSAAQKKDPDSTVNTENVQPTSAAGDESLPSPPADTEFIIPPPSPFEDVDLDSLPEVKIDSTSQTEAADVPPAPPLP